MTSSQVQVSETPPMSQEDLETLAKNETDENGLILGKYKSVEDLAASYKELEGKLGSFEKSEEAEEEVEEEESTEESEEDDGISVDEYGTEWYEDEVGTWWYREEGAEDWSEYNE